MYRSTKTFGHELGLSACFRQWRATHSHCSLLHGYALSFKFTFECDELDDRNWVVDFGGLKRLKEGLVNTFDHKLVIAEDDPAREYFERMGELSLAEVVIAPAVGCEMFAKLGWQYADAIIRHYGMEYRVRVVSCECAEHGANSAIYIPNNS
jgi:6-pyruvoyltetrahydropterin/6-carboxytetrahydropterin synthase